MKSGTTLNVIFCAWLGALAQVGAGEQTSPFLVPPPVGILLEKHCISCHDEDTQKGDISLEQLDEISLEARLELLNRAQEQLFFEEMPPEKSKNQPTAAERASLVEWVSAELARHNASKLEEKLEQPAFGNFVDHDKLFSGEFANLPGFTKDRRWLISEFIFDAKMNRITNYNPYITVDGVRHHIPHLTSGFRLNLTNPFLLPTNTGVRYYANGTLNGGHLLTMITNAKDTATLLTTHFARRDHRFLPAVSTIMKLEDTHRKLLESRQSFLGHHIEKVLVDLYGDKHTALLPAFTPTKIKPADFSSDGQEIKKSPFHAAHPGNDQLEIIYRAMLRHSTAGDTDAQLIAKCEHQWFIHGHNRRKVQARINFMAGYMEDLHKNIEKGNLRERHKPHDYKPPKEEEMAIIRESLLEHRKTGDSFQVVLDKCTAAWKEGFRQQQLAAGPPDDELVGQLVDELFIKIHERSPTPEEAQKYTSLTRSYIDGLGNFEAIQKLIQTLILRTDFVYRSEFGDGEADEHERRMMSPRDASYALAYALTDSSPDAELVKAVEEGRLNTREDYRREVLRMLERRDQYYIIDERAARKQEVASFTNMPIRELRFIREFFGYPNMLPIFKDPKRFGKGYDGRKERLVAEADRLVEHILEKDQKVFETLLTTDKFYVYHSGDNTAMKEASDRLRKIYDYFKDKGWTDFELEDLVEHIDFLTESKMPGIHPERFKPGSNHNPLPQFKKSMQSIEMRFAKGQSAAPPYGANPRSRTGGHLIGPEVAEFFNIKLDDWDYPVAQPAKVSHRKGMLTHPAWLIAHSQNTATDPVIRGKWIREKLLAGTIPEIPITVEAVVPEDHHKTLRTRLAGVTEDSYCWRCHQRMNPLGYAFEMYDDFGRFRSQEYLEYPEHLIEKRPDKGEPHVSLRDVYKTLPVDSRGRLEGTGDDTLDGEVDGAIDLVTRLAKSHRARQSFIRHAFRYFMGRNESLSDSKTLIEADRAYVESDGSFDALIVSLLTSDSFVYRKANPNPQAPNHE